MTKILIVEDTESIALLYKVMLLKHGYDVDVVGTAKDADKVLLQTDFDLIILDIGLPDRDGLDLLSDILLRDRLAKIIVVTANGSMNKAVEAMRLGGADFLVKPVNEVKFIQAIEKVLAVVGLNEVDQRLLMNENKKNALSERVRPLLGVPLADVERSIIEETIDYCGGSLPKAAEILQVAPSTLYRKKDSWE